MLVLRIIALGGFIVFPGWLLTRALGRDSLHQWERIYLVLVLGTVISSLGALFLASIGSLKLLNLLFLVLLPALGLGFITVRNRNRKLKPNLVHVLMVVLAVVFVILVISPPSMIIYGWTDVGIYPNIAAHMTRKGSISIEDSLVRQVSPGNRELVFRPNENPEVPIEAYQNKALFITDFEKGEIRPQFLYLWPSLMAVFALFLGLENMFWAITWVSLLTLGGLYLVGNRWLGRGWACITVFLALISPLFLYFSRYTSSEMMNAALMISAVLCHVAYLEAQRSGRKKEALGMATASAALLCAGFLCRVDFFMIVPPVLAFYLYKRIFLEFDSADLMFFLVFLGGGISCALIDYLISKPYFMRLFQSFDKPIRMLFDFPGLVLISVYFILFAFGRRYGQKLKPALARIFLRVKYISVSIFYAALGTYLAYLCFVRPNEPLTYGSYGEINAIVGPTYNNETLIRWAWYFSWVGVVAVFLGYALFICLRKDFSSRMFAVVGLTFTLVYSLSLHCTPMHILTMRRLVPVILPFALIMIVYAVKQVTGFVMQLRPARFFQWAGKIVGAVTIAYVAFFSIHVSQPIFGLQEGGNQYELFKEMAGSVQEGGVMVMDHHAGDICGVPLKCFFDVENLWLVDNFTLGREEFVSLLRDLNFPRRPVYILWRPQTKIISIPAQEGLRYDLVSRLFWREEMLEQSFVSRPRKRVYHLEAFEIYRISKVI